MNDLPAGTNSERGASRRAFISSTAVVASAAVGSQLLPTSAQAAQGAASGTGEVFEQWPPGPGRPLRPQRPDRELRQIIDEIDPRRIEATVRKLVSFGTRHTLSSQDDPNRGIGAARDWIAAQLSQYAAASGGRMTVTVPSYIQQPADRIPTPTRISNVVATLRG